MIEKEGKVTGMGAIRMVDRLTAEVKRMRVAPESQGKGYGRLILYGLISRAAGLGYSNLILETSVQQSAARRLYESTGFKELQISTRFA